MRSVDAHIHVDRLDSPCLFAEQARMEGVGLFSNTLVPQDFQRVCDLLETYDNVRVGVGLHPWWVGSDEAERQSQMEQALAALEGWRYVGEVGLDAAPSHVQTLDGQIGVLGELMRACANEGGKVISLHCVRAHDAMYEILRTTGVTDSCTCILHWFSGSHAQLMEAVRLGCWFSVGERMLATKRGRAYVRTIPSDRLLLETDAPPAEGGLRNAESMLKDVLGEEQLTLTAKRATSLFAFA